MGKDSPDKEEKSNIIFGSIHYIVTLIFFILILSNIIALTKATINMSVNSDDENAKKAKELMGTACIIAYVGDLLIILFLILAYSYRSYNTDDVKSYYDKIMNLTGGENLYAAMRIVVFSILMFISVVVSALCLDAAKYINISDDPEQYNDEYNLCKSLGSLFMLHFIIFTTIQGISYVYQLFYNSGAIDIPPESLTTG